MNNLARWWAAGALAVLIGLGAALVSVSQVAAAEEKPAVVKQAGPAATEAELDKQKTDKASSTAQKKTRPHGKQKPKAQSTKKQPLQVAEKAKAESKRGPKTQGPKELRAQAKNKKLAKGTRGKRKVQRFGWVIELRPEKKDYYIRLHKHTWPGVLKQIRKSNIRNYSIFLAELEGKLYLFSYFEYVGDDFEADMKAMAADPVTQRWWKETDPCQKRLPGTPEGQQWLQIPEVFHTD